MSESAGSLPDVAEQLMSEFEQVIPISVVTDVVLRLCRDGSVPVSDLLDLAREELRSVALADGAAA